MQSVESDSIGGNQIVAYSRAQSPAFRAMCDVPRGLIDAALPNAIRRWLRKAKSDVFDSKAFFKRLRQGM